MKYSEWPFWRQCIIMQCYSHKSSWTECIIENKVSGFIVNSVEEMSKIIINRQKVENARQRVMTNFTWKKTASTILEQL